MNRVRLKINPPRMLYSRVRASSRAQAFLLLSASVLTSLSGSAPRDWRASPVSETEIDEALQSAASAALGKREGAVIVMDPQTGRIRAIANPEVAFASTAAPGSAIKPFTALAALRSGLIDKDSRTVCHERYSRGDFSTVCSHPRELPALDTAAAIAYSCNYYFGKLAERLNDDSLYETLRSFGFGRPTGVDDGSAPGSARILAGGPRSERPHPPGSPARQPGGLADGRHAYLVASIQEASGTLRRCGSESSETVGSARSAAPSQQADCKPREALGETDRIQVTPIQLLTAYVALLNGGHLFEPRVADAKEFRSLERARLDIAAEHRRIIVTGMRGAVRYGTARNAELGGLPFEVIGKTGTSLPIRGFKTQGWFVGFAVEPKENDQLDPKLAVLLFIKHAHGAEAAAVSNAIFEAYANAIRGTETRSSELAENGIELNDHSSLTARPAVGTDQDLTTTVSDNSAIPNAVSPEPGSPAGQPRWGGGGQPGGGAGPKSEVRIRLVRENVTRDVPLEDYVLGVLRAEGSMETEPEALKALAVVIRTFALKNRGRHARDGYDFCSTTHCQRFLGAHPEGSSSSREGALVSALKGTEGEILVDERGQLADAYFSASCGGMTANIGTLWGTNPPAYLRGVHDEFCLAGPHANWTDEISRADLLHALQSDPRTDVGARLDQVVVSKRDETGRAEFVTLEGEHRKTIRGWDFKIIIGRVLGWNLLKGSRFEVARSGSNFIFRGRGFGHGLGLCQEGAHVMAQRGAGYQQILAKYFPETSIARGSQVSARLAGNESCGFNAKDAKVCAEVAEAGAELSEQNLRVPLRNPLRSFDDCASQIWKADLLPVLRASDAARRNLTKDVKPQSGEMFIAQRLTLKGQLRRSAMFTAAGDESHCAPAELVNRSITPIYKHFVPPGLTRKPKFSSISSGHFRATLPSNLDRHDADLVLNTLEAAREDFLRRIAAASISIGALPSLEIHINDSTGDFVGRTGQPWWAAAATKGGRIELQPVAVLEHRGVLRTTLRHELAHVVIDAVSHEHAPRWLAEGFAIYLAGEGVLISRYAPKTRLLGEEIDQRLERPHSQQEMRSLYAAAFREVRALILAEGEKGVWQGLAHYSTQRSSSGSQVGAKLLRDLLGVQSELRVSICNPRTAS